MTAAQTTAILTLIQVATQKQQQHQWHNRMVGQKPVQCPPLQGPGVCTHPWTQLYFGTPAPPTCGVYHSYRASVAEAATQRDKELSAKISGF